MLTQPDAHKGAAAIHLDTLLHGSPGTGKSMWYKCLINEIEDYVMVLELDRSFQNQLADWFTGLFEYANTQQNEDGTPRRTYLIIDELDGVITQTAKVRNASVKKDWQSLQSYPNMTIIATTNSPKESPLAVIQRFTDPVEYNPRTPDLIVQVMKSKCEEWKEDNPYTMTDIEWVEVAHLMEPVLDDPQCPREIWTTVHSKAARKAVGDGSNMITVDTFKAVLKTMTKQETHVSEWFNATFKHGGVPEGVGPGVAMFLKEIYDIMPANVKKSLFPNESVAAKARTWTSPFDAIQEHRDGVEKLMAHISSACGQTITQRCNPSQNGSKFYELKRAPVYDEIDKDKVVGYKQAKSVKQTARGGEYIQWVTFIPNWLPGSMQARCVELARQFGFKDEVLNTTTFWEIPLTPPISQLPDHAYTRNQVTLEINLLADTLKAKINGGFYGNAVYFDEDVIRTICHLRIYNAQYFDKPHTFELVSIPGNIAEGSSSVQCMIRDGSEQVSVSLPTYQCKQLFTNRLQEMVDDENAKKVLAAKGKHVVHNPVPRRPPLNLS